MLMCSRRPAEGGAQVEDAALLRAVLHPEVPQHAQLRPVVAEHVGAAALQLLHRVARIHVTDGSRAVFIQVRSPNRMNTRAVTGTS